MTERVLHITRDLPPHTRGGISTAVDYLLREQVDRGLPVAAISFDDWRPTRGANAVAPPTPETAPAGCPVLRVQCPEDLAAARDLAASHRPSRLHVHDALLWEFAATLRRELRPEPACSYTAHVAHAHQQQLRGSEERTLGMLGEERALREADEVIAPTHAAACTLRRVAVPRNAVRVEPPRIPPLLYLSPAFERDPRGVLYAGRLEVLKGFGDLLSAWSQVVAEEPRAHLSIAGGVPGNRKAEARWRRRIEELPSGSVTFHGWLAPDELATLRRRTRYLVVPSRTETFGLSALEGVAAGQVVIATPVDGLAEQARTAATGFRLVPPALHAVDPVGALATTLLDALGTA